MPSQCSQLLWEVKQDKHLHFRGEEGGEVSLRMAEGDRGSDRRRVSAVVCLGLGCFLLDEAVSEGEAEEGSQAFGAQVSKDADLGRAAVGRVPQTAWWHSRHKGLLGRRGL